MSKFLLFIFCFCFFNSSVLFAQRQHLLFENSFEGSAVNDAYLTGTIGGAMHNEQHCCSYSIQKATTGGLFTARAGTGAVRYELRSTDPVVSQSLRAELTMPNGYTDVGERWYGFSYYFENWLSDSRVSHELQFHPDNSTGAAVLQLRTTNNRFEIVHGTVATGYDHDFWPPGSVVSNVWVDFVFHVKWAADNTGFLEVWKDGVLLFNESNIVTSEPEGQYVKIGINNWTWYEGNVGSVTQRVFYIDEIRVGDALATYCDVAPDIPNDRALGATLLTPGSGCTGAVYANNCASRNTGESTLQTCSGITEAPSWFKFVAPASGAVRISTDVGSGNTFPDSKVSLYSATDANNYSTFSVIACDDDGGSVLGTGLMSVVYATGLTSGNTYYIAVDKKTSATASGTFCITVDELNSSMLATASNCASVYQTPTATGNTTYTGWQPLVNASSKLIALVRNPAGGPVDAFSVSQNINAAAVRTDATSGQKYLNRNFLINNSGSATNVQVKFFFLTSELTALQAMDPAVSLSNLGVTRQTGSTCNNNFLTANGTNSYLQQTGNGTSTDGSVKWIQITTPGFSNFYLHTSKAFVPVKTFLQGAWPAIGTGPFYRHKDVSTTWATALNMHALNQPYNAAPFNYAGTESVSSGFFTSSADTANILDWVLLELRDATTPSTVIKQRAAFIREDGRIVDLNGIDGLSFRDVTTGNYFVVVRHRNHLPIRTSTTRSLNGSLGSSAPALYDFSNAQSQAFQNTAVAMDTLFVGSSGLTPQTYGMWAGNVNYVTGNALSHTTVRASGGQTISDYLQLVNTGLSGNIAAIVGTSGSPVYNSADLNMDGIIRVSGGQNLSDYLMLINFALAGTVTAIITQQQ